MTRDELIEAIESAERRVVALRPALEAAAERPLPAGSWRVRDALSHLAARANPIPRVLQRIEESESGAVAPRPPIDDINAEQVEERVGLTVSELLDEIQSGHRATLAGIPGDEVLVKMLPAFGGGEITVAEMIARVGVGHEANHLNEIEPVVSA